MVENKVDRDVPLDLEWRGEKVFSLWYELREDAYRFLLLILKRTVNALLSVRHSLTAWITLRRSARPALSNLMNPASTSNLR